MAGLYDRDQFVLLKTTLDEAPTLVAVAAIFALVIEGGRALEFTGRSHPFLLWGMLTGVLIAARAAARFVVVRTTASERILVIGDAATTAMLERKLAADPGLNAEVVGRVSVELGPREEDDTARNRRGPAGCAQRARGGARDRGPDARGHGHRGRHPPGDGVRGQGLGAPADARGDRARRWSSTTWAARPLLGVRGFGLSPSSRVLKRCFDLVVATLVVIVLAPFLLVVVIAVKLSSPGPVVFRQTRIGRDGNEFRMWKFRTMVHDADERKQELARGQRGRTALQDRRRPAGPPGWAASSGGVRSMSCPS